MRASRLPGTGDYPLPVLEPLSNAGSIPAAVFSQMRVWEKHAAQTPGADHYDPSQGLALTERNGGGSGVFISKDESNHLVEVEKKAALTPGPWEFTGPADPTVRAPLGSVVTYSTRANTQTERNEFETHCVPSHCGRYTNNCTSISCTTHMHPTRSAPVGGLMWRQEEQDYMDKIVQKGKRLPGPGFYDPNPAVRARYGGVGYRKFAIHAQTSFLFTSNAPHEQKRRASFPRISQLFHGRLRKGCRPVPRSGRPCSRHPDCY